MLGFFDRVSSWYSKNESFLKTTGVRIVAVLCFVVGIVYLFKFFGGVF